MALISDLNKITILSLLDMACFSMFIVSFAPHVTSLGGSELYIGSIYSFLSLIGLIWNPIIGSLSDTYGRKFILEKLLLTSIISHLFLVFSNSLLIIFISRMIAAFTTQVLPIMKSLASEALSKDDSAKYMNKIPMLHSISFILGSLIGGFLMEQTNGATLCFTVMSLMTTINYAIVLTLPETIKTEKSKIESLSIKDSVKREMKNVFTKLSNVDWNEYSDIFSVKLCMEFACGLFFRSIGPMCYRHFMLKGRSMGYLFTTMSVSTIITTIIYNKIKNTQYKDDKLGNKRLFHASLIFLITAIGLSSSNSLPLFVLSLLPMTTARTISDSTFAEALMSKASIKDKGGVFGAFESITSFCGLITPIIYGIISDNYGIKTVLIISIIPSLIGLFLTYSKRNRK